MAETKPSKKTAAKKRIVKNPETFRERAIKASETGDIPKRSARLKAAAGKATKPVLQPVGKASGKVFGLKPFLLLRKPLRIVGKILVPVYVRNSWGELRLVVWPSWKESRDLTFAVLVFAIIFGVIVAAVDFGLDRLFRDVLLK
ncbi:MAG: Protein translocase subunit SecE [Candidatus Saccharibacteria bacterium]|nr:Protein translocase subunit SecE [Candidatus Saccharibacteria bacterium]